MGNCIVKSSNKQPSTGGDSSGTTFSSSTVAVTENLKKFNYSELRKATRNFEANTRLGDGQFWSVFKGWVDSVTYSPSKVCVGVAIAVKKLDPRSHLEITEWQALVNFVANLRHPNLVKLVGYCKEDGNFVLVYEYMQKRRYTIESLPWSTRIKITIDASRGLAFLHATKQDAFYLGFNASKILLDGDFNARLSDFGFTKLSIKPNDARIIPRIYAAPEYMQTGVLCIANDVYCFGVVLLEVLTGRRLTYRSSGQGLIDWALPALREKKVKLTIIMDPRLENIYPFKGAQKLAEVIVRCLEDDLRK